MRRKYAVFALVLVLLCTACAPSQKVEGQGEGEYALYFAVAPREDGTAGRPDSAAMDCEYAALPREGEEVEELLALLFAGPTQPGLVSPFPAGVAVRGWARDQGTLRLDLSEAYGGLSGVELTLADCCIVRTLCQLPGVEAVYLTVEGRARPFRDQVLTPDDFVLDNALEGVAPSSDKSQTDGGESQGAAEAADQDVP